MLKDDLKKTTILMLQNLPKSTDVFVFFNMKVSHSNLSVHP